VHPVIVAEVLSHDAVAAGGAALELYGLAQETQPRVGRARAKGMRYALVPLEEVGTRHSQGGEQRLQVREVVPVRTVCRREQRRYRIRRGVLEREKIGQPDVDLR